MKFGHWTERCNEFKVTANNMNKKNNHTFQMCIENKTNTFEDKKNK